MKPALDEVQAIVRWLCKAFPEAKDAPALRTAVRKQIRAAKGYGLQLQTELSAYVAVAWLMGPRFDKEFPVARGVLENPLMPPALKANFLAQWCTRVFSAITEE